MAELSMIERLKNANVVDYALSNPNNVCYKILTYFNKIYCIPMFTRQYTYFLSGGSVKRI